MNNQQIEALESLGYDLRWIEYDVLSVPQLLAQYSAFREPGADRHKEHYRLATWTHYFRSRSALSDIELRNLIELANDPDFETVSGIPQMLVDAKFLTDEQFEIVAQFVSQLGYTRRVRRARLLRELENDFDGETLGWLIEHGDSVVQRAVFGHPYLSSEHLAKLVDIGRNKQVRNKARQLLASRRFRPNASECKPTTASSHVAKELHVECDPETGE